MSKPVHFSFVHRYHLSSDVLTQYTGIQPTTWVLTHHFLDSEHDPKEILLRNTTDRNPVVRKLKQCRRPLLFKFERQKPYKIFSNMTPEFKIQLAKWNRLRPRGERRPPDGFEYVEIGAGEFELIESLTPGRFNHLSKQWKEKTVTRLVPIDRKKSRNRKPFSNAKVNDLEFFHQFSDSIPIYQRLNTSDQRGIHFSGDVYHNYDVGGDLLAFPFVLYGLPEEPILRPSSVLATQSGLLDELDGEIQSLSEVALRRHYAKLQNQKIDLASELAQGFQVINMISDLAVRISKSLLLLKKGRVLDSLGNLLPHTSKQVARDYLTYVYGIKPLLSDAFGAAEHLAEYIQRSAPVKSNGHAKRTLPTRKTPHVVNTTIGQFSKGELSETTEIRVKYGSEFVISDSLSRTAAQLGFTNPANVVWELAPFSFVVDWFLPIGNFLSQLTALNGLSLKVTYKTVFIKRKYVFTMSSTPELLSEGWLNGFRYHGTPPFSYTWDFTLVYCRREVISLPSVPSPRFKNPASATHLSNAIALINALR